MSTVLKVVGASWLRTKISSYILGILGILAILALFVGQIERIQEDGNYAATVFYSEKTGYRIEYWGQSNELANIPTGAARAYFRTDVDATGWSVLEVETNSTYPDEIQAYAAGVVEGALTWYLIHTHLENTIREKCEDTPMEKQCNKFKDALDKSVDIWKKYAADHANEDSFWHQVSLYYTQIRGIFTGWKHGVERSTREYETDKSDLYWLNSLADVAELQHKLNISVENSILDHLPHLSTAFIRIINETEDGIIRKKMFVAQNAVGNYSSMTRILKRYKLNYHVTPKSSELVSGTSVEFSGYPGSITSQDEFYVVSGKEHKMAVTGTTLRNYNEKLWKDVNINEQIPVSPRVLAANHLGNNVSSWGHILARSNSGTASKQWLVVDFARSERQNTLNTKTLRNEVFTESSINKHVRHTVVHRASSGRQRGLAALVEQVPGLTHCADLSDVLVEKGYWASYGLPFFKDVAETTHVKQMEELHGQIFSESESPRAVLFKRGYKNATSLESIIKLMRQNNVTAMNRASKDMFCDDMDCVISERGYWSVLGVRGDIVNNGRQAFGVIDTKIVSGILNSSKALDFIAVGGPPYTEIQANTTVQLNKGNVAPIYTQQFNDKPDINGMEIRDLVTQQQEEAAEEKLELLNKDAVKPFDWSESVFTNNSHTGLPDRWAFNQYKLNWSF